MSKPTSVWLKAWRQRRGWTQERAARELEYSERAYKGWEYGAACRKSVITTAKAIEEKHKEGK